jgi:hypothetical protein
MEICGCGASLRTFWVWRDSRDVLHASAFKPTSESEQALHATTARDALLPLSGDRTPKHDVRSVSNPSQVWEGRCAAVLATAQVAI